MTLPLEKGIATTPPAPEYPVFMFAVEVRNSGGAAVTVDKASIDMDQGVSFFQPAPSVGPACPFRLEAHSATTFLLEPKAIDTAVKVLKLEPEVSASIVLASGPVHRTKKVKLRELP